MKMRTSIFLLIILAFISNTAFAFNINNNLMSTQMNKYEKQNIITKIENKSQVSYVSNNTEKQENQIINSIMKKLNYKLKNNRYIAKNGQIVDINIFRYKNKTYVDISEYTKKSDDSILPRILKELKNNKFSDYSFTVKYKIEHGMNNRVLSYLKKTLFNIKLFNYSGGIFGTGYINGDKISFAIANYETNSYLIIGNPIINISY